jgi:hypothetical protein
MRQLLLLSLPPVSVDALAVVVDQVELAAGGEDAGEDEDGGLLGGGVAEAGSTAGAGGGEDEAREPNHRVRRLPPLLGGLLLSCCSVATEVLQELGAVLGLLVPCGALPAAVGAGAAAGAGAGADVLLSLRPNFGHQLLRGSAEALAWL